MSSHKHLESEKCFNILDFIEKRNNSDQAFSGVLHSITGIVATLFVAIIVLLTGWGEQYMKWEYSAMLIAFSLSLIGATLLPDLDNTRSTSHSALGVFGDIMSFFFRSSSVFIQTVVRSPKDDDGANPHRGFWHTLISTVLLAIGLFFLFKISKTIELPFLGEQKIGNIIALIVLSTMIHLFMAAFAKKTVKKFKKWGFVGEILAFLLSFTIALVLYISIDNTNNFMWLAISIMLGSITHILGDAFTKQGCPLFFPLSIFTKGRFWWYTRFATITSGDEKEEAGVITVLGIIIVVQVIAILGLTIFS